MNEEQNRAGASQHCIRVNEQPLTVTMRTPGHDRELTAGFLWAEGLIDAREQIVRLRQNESERGGLRST